MYHYLRVMAYSVHHRGAHALGLAHISMALGSICLHNESAPIYQKSRVQITNSPALPIAAKSTSRAEQDAGFRDNLSDLFAAAMRKKMVR